jgi:hypothetical protein
MAQNAMTQNTMTHNAMAQTIYCFNKSTVLKDTDMFLMIAAINTLLPAFCSVWSPKQYVCRAAPANMKLTTDLYCVFLDTTDAKNALAYHTEISNVSISRIFVKTILQYRGAILLGATSAIPTVAQAFSHEIFEMIVNMNVNIWWRRPDGSLVPAEVADPVQGNVVIVTIGNIRIGMSDYVLPSWPDTQSTKGPYNLLNTLSRPFQIARGGYVIVMRGGSATSVFGAVSTEYSSQHSSETSSQHSSQHSSQPISVTAEFGSATSEYSKLNAYHRCHNIDNCTEIHDENKL